MFVFVRGRGQKGGAGGGERRFVFMKERER